MKLRRLPLPTLLLGLLPGVLCATEQSSTDNLKDVPPELLAVVGQLHPQHGKIDIGNGLATLDMPDSLGYLPPDQTDILLHRVLHYVPKVSNLGCIVPTDVAIGTPTSWEAIITYQEDGHVSDADAANLDTGAVLAAMQEENKARNVKLAGMGFSRMGINLLGWAATPHYDDAAHKLSWAIEILPAESGQHNLNYHIRVLGRKGMLETLIVSPLEQLPILEDNAKKILSLMEFKSPNRYADFNPDTDRKAAYGISDVITGHTAAQTIHHTQASQTPGLWLILLSLLAAGGLLWKTLGRRKR